MTYSIGDTVEVNYNYSWYKGTVVSGPKIILSNKYYEIQFVYKEYGKPEEMITKTFGTSEIRDPQ